MNQKSVRYLIWAAPLLGAFLLLPSSSVLLLGLRLVVLAVAVILLLLGLRAHLTDIKRDNRPKDAPFWS